jgi:hypothetical protein
MARSHPRRFTKRFFLILLQQMQVTATLGCH